MAQELARLCISIPADLFEEFDQYVKKRGITKNRSEVIRDLMREALGSDVLDRDPNTFAAGTLTMLYDHHTPELNHKLDHMQHEYPAEIISSMHVHLTHHLCLEVIALKGTLGTLQEIAHKILGVKGVTQGSINIIAYDMEE